MKIVPDHLPPISILKSFVPRSTSQVFRGFILLFIGMITGTYLYQYATQNPLIVHQTDVMVGTAKPGGTVTINIKRGFGGACHKFIIERTLWRWQDKTKTTVAMGGLREYAPIDFTSEAAIFSDDVEFKLDLSLINVPREPDPAASRWYYTTKFIPDCPFYVYSPVNWFNRPEVFITMNAPITMSPADKRPYDNEPFGVTIDKGPP